MSVTPETLLKHLPPFRNERVLIERDQRVNDIIEQILKAHEKYAHYYNELAKYFDADTTEQICSNIYNFLSGNIVYREESDDEQTTALPGAILSLKHGDCKHYSLFAAGILDALRRRGKKINWCYRFCSYKLLDKTPHHVFVVVKKNDGSEIWIDAVPGASELTPLWQLDKQVKNISMPLYDVVGNVNNDSGAVGGASVGYTTGEQLLHAAAKVNPLLIIGRAAFLQMLKWNVRAWAKNIQDLTAKYGRQASDPIGKRWYLFGGDSAPFWSAAVEGSTKPMLGSTQNENSVGVLDPVSIAAMLTAAAPIVIAMVGLVKSLTGKTDWQEGQSIYTPGTTPPGGTTSTVTDFLKNPMVLAGGAALAYYLYSTQTRRKVNGADNTMLWLLLLAGGGYLLYKKSQQEQPPDSTIPGEVLPPEQIPYVPEESIYAQPIVTEESYNSGYAGGGGSDVIYKDFEMDSSIPYEAMM